MSKHCPLCSSSNTEHLIDISSKPARETDYSIEAENYFRSIHKCHHCSVYFSSHDYDFELLYQGNYNASTYQNKLQKTYDKIMSLPKEQSDNALRCERIIKELESKNMRKDEVTILDVGSGLCVFLGKMKSLGYKGFAVDPDQTSVDHALNYVKVDKAYCGKIENFNLNSPVSLLTMNKVLEHVPDPKLLLTQALQKVAPNGLCYLELPNGEIAEREGGLIDRQEFFIEHYFAFTKKSMTYLMESCGLKDVKVESVNDPSGKYSLFGFGTV